MWLESYLKERTQAVAIRYSTAPSVELQRGVPQGSVLGPILFTIYTLALGDIVRRHDLKEHFYADDMQLYVSFDIKNNPFHHVHRMEACVKDIKMWVAGIHLKLNDNKTEVITFTAPNVEMNMPIDVIHIGDYSIPPVKCVRDLGVVFNHSMTMHENITKTCASCYFHLRNISSIRDSLTDEATTQLVYAFVSSRIDYCNSLLYGIPENAVKRLQRVQNFVCPCRHAFVKVQQHNADAEEIALAACEVSHNIQSSAVYLQGTARYGTELLEDSAAKLHAFSLTEIRDWKFTHHAESTLQIRMPYFRLCGPQVVERTTCEH